MSSGSEKDNTTDDEDYAPSGGEEAENEEEVDPEQEDTHFSEKEEVSKEKVDDLWNKFKTDVSKPTKCAAGGESNMKETEVGMDAKQEQKIVDKMNGDGMRKMITITKVYDFAGEEVKVTKEIDKDSKEARNHMNQGTTPGPKSTKPLSKLKRSGGLQGVLGKMSKKPKMSTLEKSKLDWQNYKAEEGIQEELNTHNRGKGGYLEKVSFLERTDYRQFERERDMRLAKR